MTGQAILAALAVVLFGSTSSYFQNAAEFSFSYLELLPYLLILTFVCALVFVALARLLSLALPSARYWLIPAVSVALWLQGAFNVPAYGPLDGSEIAWSDFARQSWKDLAVFALVGLGFYVFRTGVRRQPLAIPAALVFVQLASAAVAAREAEANEPSSTPDESVYRFSTTENVVLVVVDGFQSDVLQEILNQRPEYREVLNGFTYFPNAVGFHPSTVASIPALFVGQHYRNEQRISNFQRDIFSERSAIRAFADQGFQVDLIYRAGFPPGDKSKAPVDNIVPADHLAISWRNALEEAVEAFEYTLFRSSPQRLRQSLYAHGVWLLSSQIFRGYPNSPSHRADLRLVEEMEQRARAEGDRPVFKFLHVYTPHLPIVLDAALEPVSRPFNRETYVEQAEGALRLLARLLDTLRKIGAYDNSRIVVVGDHGRKGIEIRSDVLERLGRDRSAPASAGLTPVMSGALPVFLAKPPNARGALVTDHAPVSHADVAPSLLDGKPQAGRFAGYSVFSSSGIPADRRREFLYYEWDRHGWSASHLDPMTVYVVDGYSWLRSSWKRPVQTILRGGKTQELPTHEYKIGTVLDFHAGGNAAPFLVSGWGGAERTRRWTVGPVASVVLPGEFGVRDYTLRFSASPYLGTGQVERQVVRVEVNGHGVGEAVLTKGGARVLEFKIPAAIVDPARIVVQLRMPHHVSPRSLGIRSDRRSLGISVTGFSVE